MRTVCLDIGIKRIGVAVTDPSGATAGAHSVIERKGKGKDIEKIAALCNELSALRLVIGLPLNEEGEEGPEAKKVKDFADELCRRLLALGADIEIFFWDERYSTKIAEERLIAADVSREKRKRVIDKMAALVILEDYLENSRDRVSFPQG